MGTYDTIGGTPISPDDSYCEDWSSEGCLNPECPFHDPNCFGGCGYNWLAEEV